MGDDYSGQFWPFLGVLQFIEIKPFNDILQTERPGMTMGHRNVAAEYVLMCVGAAFSRIKGMKNWQTYISIFWRYFLCVTVIF